jgi:hypothetical protein
MYMSGDVNEGTVETVMFTIKPMETLSLLLVEKCLSKRLNYSDMLE